MVQNPLKIIFKRRSAKGYYMDIKVLSENDIGKEETLRLNALQRQLRGDGFRNLTLLEWEKMADQSGLEMIAGFERGEIIGMSILRWHDLPGGRTATLEDVVVDLAHRGKGYGELLVKEIIKMARKTKVDFLDLTSHPSREAANKLYQKLGWEKRNTNLYRFKINR